MRDEYQGSPFCVEIRFLSRDYQGGTRFLETHARTGRDTYQKRERERERERERVTGRERVRERQGGRETERGRER